jgi:hypothetical protein
MVKSLIGCTIASGCLLIGWAAWQLRPFTPAGRQVCLGNWAFNEYELQVWQIKKATLSEPFSTSLYVRFRTNAWHQFYLNHQDNYTPSYVLLKTNETVIVNRGNKVLGTFDLNSGKYERTGGGVSLEDVFWRNPP